jgi:hypothetical protein
MRTVSIDILLMMHCVNFAIMGVRMPSMQSSIALMEERLRNDGPEWFLALLDSCKEDVMANLVMIMWRAWPVCNKVTRAGEVLSIDESFVYLTRLGQELQ